MGWTRHRDSAWRRRVADRAGLQTKCELRADPDGVLGQVPEGIGYWPLPEDRVAPVVEPDELGQHLGTQAPAVTRDAIDPEAD